MSAVYREAGVSFPEIVREPGWNEFDLTHVYRALAPSLCAEDPEFERQYQELVAQARAAAEQPEASVNRRWLPCDVKVVEAWMRGRHAYEGETWQAFRERVIGCRLQAGARGARREHRGVYLRHADRNMDGAGHGDP